MLVRIIWSLFTLDWFQWHKNMAHYTKQAAAGLEEGGWLQDICTTAPKHQTQFNISSSAAAAAAAALKKKKKKKIGFLSSQEGSDSSQI